MTRKDYVALAQAINTSTRHQPTDGAFAEGWHAGVVAVRENIADALAADNARFDRSRFLAACRNTGGAK
jgi:hypothetical protein